MADLSGCWMTGPPKVRSGSGSCEPVRDWGERGRGCKESGNQRRCWQVSFWLGALRAPLTKDGVHGENGWGPGAEEFPLGEGQDWLQVPQPLVAPRGRGFEPQVRGLRC